MLNEEFGYNAAQLELDRCGLGWVGSLVVLGRKVGCQKTLFDCYCSRHSECSSLYRLDFKHAIHDFRLSRHFRGLRRSTFGNDFWELFRDLVKL